MSTLAVVEAILREASMPLSVREIVERAGDVLPTKSKTPDTVVARDLSMDIKKRGEVSAFVRTSPGRYAIRAQAAAQQGDEQSISDSASVGQSFSQPVNVTPASPAPAGVAAMDAPTPLVGQSLTHDRNGARPAPAKAPGKQSSEDTPMSA